MTQETRSQIYALKSIGTSLRKIDTVVERHVSTISREIQRNIGDRGYRYKQANAKAVDRRTNASRTPKKLTSELIAIIETHLREEWSPDQIAGHLKRTGHDWVSHKTIYQLMHHSLINWHCIIFYVGSMKGDIIKNSTHCRISTEIFWMRFLINFGITMTRY